MTTLKAVVAALVLGLCMVPSARAQVTVDISKITCEQFILHKITDPDRIVFWLSGYFNGKRNHTLLDTQLLEANAKKLTEYCIMHPQVPVMQAVETLFNPTTPAR